MFILWEQTCSALEGFRQDYGVNLEDGILPKQSLLNQQANVTSSIKGQCDVGGKTEQRF